MYGMKIQVLYGFCCTLETNQFPVQFSTNVHIKQYAATVCRGRQSEYKNECNSRNFYDAACDEHCNNAIENNTIEYVNCENCLVIYGNTKKKKLYIQQMHAHVHK